MTTLLIGFDSAWTPNNSGALVGALQSDNGTFVELGLPRVADFPEATEAIREWQNQHSPSTTLILLDQPTIVPNAAGQRPVENLVASPVSLRYGGVQPSNTGREEMFGAEAPVWGFLDRFGGAADPFDGQTGTRVFETYPVLALIALGWTLPDRRAAGRLPKYNPARKKTFSLSDWNFVCLRAAELFSECGLEGLAGWLDRVASADSPSKAEQDHLDACICLAVAVHMAHARECLVVGDVASGYMVVPHGENLASELVARCTMTDRDSREWVRPFRVRPS